MTLTKAETSAPAMKLGTFTNSAGEVYMVNGLSPLLFQKISDAVRMEYEKSGKALLSHPTYEVKTAAGDIEIHEHDETTLVVPDDLLQTKLNQEKWQEYTRQVDELDELNTQRTMKMVLMAVVATPTQQWRDEMAFLGIPLPDKNSPAEKYSFVETHVIQSPSDLSKLMTTVFRLAGIINEEGVAQAEAAFQSIVERAFTQAGKIFTQVG